MIRRLNRLNHRQILLFVSTITLLSSVALTTGANAQSSEDIVRGIIGLIARGAEIEAAQKSWEQIEDEVKVCLRESYDIDPDQLAQNGIHSTDSRVTPYIDECRRQIALAQAQTVAREAWPNVSSDITNCLDKRHGYNTEKLIEQGIGPEDSRIQPYIQSCEKTIAETLRKQEEAGAAAQAWAGLSVDVKNCIQNRSRYNLDELAQNGVSPDDQRVRHILDSCRDEIANTKRQRDERIADLNARFPSDWVPKILQGEIEVGWSIEAVRESRGEPRQKMSTPNGTEMWIYNDMRVVISDGKVTYIERN